MPTPNLTVADIPDVRELTTKALAAAEHGYADAAGRLEHAAVVLHMLAEAMKAKHC